MKTGKLKNVSSERFPNLFKFWLIYVNMMVSLFIYKHMAFEFLTKSIASRQALHESLVWLTLFYTHIAAWNARKSVKAPLEIGGLNHWNI